MDIDGIPPKIEKMMGTRRIDPKSTDDARKRRRVKRKSQS